MLVVGAKCLDLRRILVDIESPDDHLSNVGEVNRVLEESNGNRLLDGRTVPCYHPPGNHQFPARVRNRKCTASVPKEKLKN